MFSTTAAVAPPYKVYQDRYLAELRDNFAGLAMQKMIMIELTNDYESSEERMESVARISYKMADAMLKEKMNERTD